MASEKEREAQAEREAASRQDAPPVYEMAANDTRPAPRYEMTANEEASRPVELQAEKPDKAARPTAESPFNFPTNIPLPAYSAASGSNSQQPIVIPQITPDPTAPLLSAYAPVLLRYGIPKETWTSLLETASAFLAANVSDRALRHAANMGKHVSEGPKNLAKDVYNHIKGTGKDIGKNAKRGNIIGAAAGVIGGAISIPMHVALGTARTAIGMPISAVSAAVKKPETPRERAEAYFATANEEWLRKRGLQATLLDSQELSSLLGVSVVDLVELRDSKEESAEIKLRAMEEHVARLDVDSSATLMVGPKTLWVVVTWAEPKLTIS